VRTPNARLKWGQALRSAVRSLDCSDSASLNSVQRFGFILDVVDGPGVAHQARGGAARIAFGLRPLN
jgi:hypothetical protein